MTSARLHSISIRDFRSIRGIVQVDLDAPVVLIHGSNGAGKTSIISAIEYALTGQIPSMARIDPKYEDFLVHAQAEVSELALTLSTDGTEPTCHRTRLGAGFHPTPALEPEDARFVSERCFLPQATLGRLLEIYQAKGSGNRSPLTEFVKNLLRLDRIDALIEGLHFTKDVRWIRKQVPEYEETERRLKLLSEQTAALSVEATAKTAEAEVIRDRLFDQLQEFGVFKEVNRVDDSALFELVASVHSGSGDDELTRLIGLQRELRSLRTQLESAEVAKADGSIAASTHTAEAARRAADEWTSISGAALEALIDSLRPDFPDLPSVASTQPVDAQAEALERVNSELARATKTLETAAASESDLRQLDAELERDHARIALVHDQLSSPDLMHGSEGLSLALANLAPHVTTDECPVCSRDFQEVSDVPLAEKLGRTIAKLTEDARRLQDLAASNAQAQEDLARHERERAVLVGRMIDQSARSHLKERVAQLGSVRDQLVQLNSTAVLGTKLLRAKSEAERDLANLRERESALTEFTKTLARLREMLGVAASDVSPDGELARLELEARQSFEFLSEREKTRALISTRGLELSSLLKDLAEVRRSVVELTEKRQHLEDALNDSDEWRTVSRSILARASEARSSIIQNVFSMTLNQVWRDLFVRLAPDEPYVPAFQVIEARGRVSAGLTTKDRAGNPGGSPGAMLSAGNLNSAALSLFLALHLAVKPRRRWLLLDDPVQSMDEVHVSQFAALLRTLSNEHKRQIVIAVHDRALFEYLTLELSPVDPDERLVTLEVERSKDGDTIVTPEYYHWQADAALGA